MQKRIIKLRNQMQKNYNENNLILIFWTKKYQIENDIKHQNDHKDKLILRFLRKMLIIQN